ncbi:MarR family winged helix-turn-helix transcriptional regulator [Spelaeicoccus albus]|uniref:DNA-binding MarR family transcriptional regulator n=1 Tax=Spelaeicoccus albus TaxID=1280376 RepID=A0A7Z0IIA5_9MICO|nr:MarR family winged helix-turn-helix transcriptional regulator [Spelaeicoccus albus]NYI68241.1 DNA-binding MarR family transcriptional regulator [Spelaeicoccus albus]
MGNDELTERERAAWQISIRMLEALRSRLEQQLQADSGLSLADYSVLSVLSEAPGGRLRLYELCREVRWEKSRLHHQLTRMAKRDLVDRERRGSRGIEAAITAHGFAVIREAAPGHAGAVRQLFVNPVSPADLEQFAETANSILRNLDTGQ